MTLSVRHLWSRALDLCLAIACLMDASVLLAQGPISGRVINGTTNQPAVHQKVELLTLGRRDEDGL